MTADEYQDVRRAVIAAGYLDEIEWSQIVRAPTDPTSFASELIWVICNAGMRNQTARTIFDRVMTALRHGQPAATAFCHESKCRSIDRVWKDRTAMLTAYNRATDKLAYLERLPHIGPITKWHAAKNLGLDVAEPDRHLTRLAAAEGMTVRGLCAMLAAGSGDRIATVDLVLRRACNLGLIASRSLGG